MTIEHANHVFDHEDIRLEKFLDIWRDVICLELFISDDFGAETCDLAKKERAMGRIMKYNWNNEFLMFQGLVVPMLEEKKGIVNVIHAEIGHFSEQITITEMKKRYFWHEKIEFVRKIVQECK
jgi:hypothetical protein